MCITFKTKHPPVIEQGFSMDIMRHKDAVDQIVKTGEAIMNSKDQEEKQALKVKKYHNIRLLQVTQEFPLQL